MEKFHMLRRNRRIPTVKANVKNFIFSSVDFSWFQGEFYGDLRTWELNIVVKSEQEKRTVESL